MELSQATIAQVHTEQRFIAKYTGMLFARLLLMICFFSFLFYAADPGLSFCIQFSFPMDLV